MLESTTHLIAILKDAESRYEYLENQIQDIEKVKIKVKEELTINEKEVFALTKEIKRGDDEIMEIDEEIKEITAESELITENINYLNHDIENIEELILKLSFTGDNFLKRKVSKDTVPKKNLKYQMIHSDSINFVKFNDEGKTKIINPRIILCYWFRRLYNKTV
jgi:chromosome segregation ATPase